MELALKAAWVALALIHLPPAAVLVLPGLIERLYGIAPAGDLRVVIAHRGALFLAIMAACAYAAIEPGARRTASLVTAISVGAFLALYARAGLPAGPLRTVAIADLIALAPLALVACVAWRPGPA